MFLLDLGKRVLMHRLTRKVLKWGFLVALIWFSVHSFNTNYVVINSNGVHGVIARATWAAMQANATKAAAYETIPNQYLFNE
jgi:hypothetical protein